MDDDDDARPDALGEAHLTAVNLQGRTAATSQSTHDDDLMLSKYFNCHDKTIST